MQPNRSQMKPDDHSFAQDRLFFSAINYQQLLGCLANEADVLASKNQAYIQQNDQRFEQRLAQMLLDCQQGRVQNLLQWCRMQGVTELQQQLASMAVPCVLALFHLGPHRDLLPDLAASGIPFSAPIAGKVYQLFYQQKALAPAPFSDCFELLDVDHPRIGRQLLQSVRARRFLAIYVDGNMGPDGVHCKEGATTVQFGMLTIRVKVGAARLAAQFGLPILPLFCYSEGATSVVQTGTLLSPPANNEEALQQCMQQLYQQLFLRLRQRPEQWEYAACLQRWRGSDQEPIKMQPESTTEFNCNQRKSDCRYRIPQEQIRLFQLQQQHFLVHSGRGKAIVLPEFLQPYISVLTSGFNVSSTMLIQIEPLVQAGYLEVCHD